MSKDTLITTNKGYMTLAENNIGDMIAEELDGLEINFEKIKIPSGGAITYEVPGDNGEVDSVKEFCGVILYQHHLQTHYKTAFTGKNNPPDCASFDGVTGDGDPGGDCKACEYNEFGSADNGAKACKARRRIYILREGEIFPLLLSLPTCSLKEFTKYLKLLLTKGKKSNMVVTRFSLKKAVNAGGLAYSQAQFAVERDLTAEERTLIKGMSAQIKSLAGKVGFDAEDEAITVDTETGEVIDT